MILLPQTEMETHSHKTTNKSLRFTEFLPNDANNAMAIMLIAPAHRLYGESV